MGENEYFNKALSNFVQDFAHGGQIRHLADLGMSVSEIMQRLEYPTSKENAANMVWKHYVSSGRIRLEKPPENGESVKVTYVKEQSAYGKISMRRVEKRELHPGQKYVVCDFGKRIYQNRERFEQELAVLSQKDRQYIIDLPWPLQSVYHVADERMLRVAKALGNDVV